MKPIQGGMLELHEGMWDDVPIHIGKYLWRELEPREWTLTDLAERMEGDFGRNLFVLEMLCVNRYPNVLLPRRAAEAMGKALGQNAETWLGLDLAYRHMIAVGEWRLVTADCKCEACSIQPPADHYVNGKLKREQMP